MAVNLWSEAGKPTSYKGLPTGMDNMVAGLEVNTYQVLTFKARSASSKVLTINNIGNINLTPEFKEYSFETLNDDGFLRFYVSNPPTDIDIEDINLVYKTPEVKRAQKLTLNIANDFYSYEGRLAPNTTIIDAETVRLDAVSMGESSYMFVNVTPYTDYYVSAESDCEYGVFNFNASKVLKGYSLQGGTFNSEDNTTVRFYFKNAYVEKGTFYFKKPLIALGKDVVPYERKRGSIPALPTPVKNLLPSFTSGAWALTGQNLTVVDSYEVENNTPLNNYEGCRYALTQFKKGQNYTLSFDDCSEDTKIWVHYIGGGYTVRQDANSTRGAKSYTFTTPDDIVYDTIRIIFDNATSRNRMWVKKPMMTEGTAIQKFEPYEVLPNKRANVAPKKNLIKPFGDLAWTYPAVSLGRYTIESPRRIVLDATESHQYVRVPFPVEPNTDYTLSSKHNGKIGIYTYDGASGLVHYTQSQKATFNSKNNTMLRLYISNLDLGNGKFSFDDIQVEKGTVDTSYELYEETNKKAFTVPDKNKFDFKNAIVSVVGGYATLTKTDEYVEADIKAGGYGFKFANVPVEPNTDYVFSVKVDVIKGSTTGVRIHFMDTNTYSTAVSLPYQAFNSGNNTSIELMYYLGMDVKEDSLVRVSEFQLEKGTVRTPYEPYELVNKEARR
jgi:hypothetical protein